jgi:arylsulfatase
MIWDFGEYGGIVAIRDGDFKAIRRDVNREKPGDWELYNIATDPGEQHDLANENPHRVQQLEKLYLGHRTIEPDFPNLLYDK